MEHKSFLMQVAQYYASQSSLSATAFVFPNRRSSQQFEHYLMQAVKRPFIMPRVMSMNDYVDEVTRNLGLVSASPIEAMFILYNAYCAVMGDRAGEFDKFAFWGQLIVSDFNDIDMNLVDAHSLYKNLGELRDIQADYIDEDIKEALSRIMGINVRDGEDKFWRNATVTANHDADDVCSNYITLWNSMDAIYDTYTSMLQDRELTTQGKLYRKAVQLLADTPPEQMGYNRIVMVGHDMLTASEAKMFKILKNKDMAHFWWDTASPAVRDEQNPAHAIVSTFSTLFPSPEMIEPIDVFPHITIQDVPSRVGMAKCVFNGVEQLDSTKGILLPDDAMLEPLLNSLPDELIHAQADKTPSELINVTMGYQLRNSSVVSLMHLVTIAHRHAVLKENEWYFYREDVRDILSHPILKMAFTEQVIAMNNAIEEQNEFNIPASLFDTTEFASLFTTMHISMEMKSDVVAFIEGVENFCLKLFDRLNNDDATEENDPNSTLPLQCAFIMQYVSVLRQLSEAIDSIGLPVHDTTVFHLIDRMAGSAMVSFGGRSCEGLQVMGVLETRCLDFDELRILSANEGLLPQRSAINSLIPYRFRAAFNLPTRTSMSAVDAYRFYRLISRASEVTLFYDSSTDGANEPSRYIEQLHKVYGCDISRIKRTANVSNVPELDIAINKEGLPVNMAQAYTCGDPRSDKKVPCLSASSINEYILCPLQFYFHHVMKLSNDSNHTDFMDSATFGTIVHDTLQDLYYPQVPDGVERKHRFTVSDIEEFVDKRLDVALLRNVNRHFLKRTVERVDEPISGVASILYETMRLYVTEALEYDKETIESSHNGYLEIVECEDDHRIKLDLGDIKVNFTFKADRVDRIDDTLRIIDYKTGKDEPQFPDDVEKLFEEPHQANKDRPKALLQLMLYSLAMMQIVNESDMDKDKRRNKEKLEIIQGITHISPIIYKLRSMSDTRNATKGKKCRLLPVDMFREDSYVRDFVVKMSSVIKELTSMEKPFEQAALELTDHSCRYCNFKDFCRRNPNPKF